METISVGLGSRGYDVVVGRGAVEALVNNMPVGAKRAAVVTQAGIPVSVDPGIETKVFTIGDGEHAKRLATIEDLCSQFAQWGLTRNDVVIGVGGGVVTDVAGFAAATYHRGTAVVHVPTTLLGQIDAAIGGKCGVNLPEGKNLVGAFWQPQAVICDPDVLATLPPRQMRCGLGEMVKYHFLSDVDFTELSFDEQISASVRIKADVVSGDERESGRRAILNYGHTLAHALENATDHALLHGEAVAIGLIYAADLALRLGRINADRVAEHHQLLAQNDLVATMPVGLDEQVIVDLFSRDKKAIDGVTFVLDGPDGVEPVSGIDPALLIAALESVRPPEKRLNSSPNH
jgi:5-deoxy-5-amino-3-dehydroquinate synthase